MRRRAFVTLICRLVLGLASTYGGVRSAAAQTVNVTEPTQVITHDELVSLGVARLSDLVHHINDARMYSMGGFGMRSSLGGVGSFQETAPAVFVDGHPIDFGLIGSGDLDRIGLPVAGIDRVEVYARPTLITGIFAGHGAIHIYTRRADDAAELHGRSGFSAHEATPGPLSFDDGSRTRRAVDGLDLEAAALGDIGQGTVLAGIAHRSYAHADRAGDGGSRPLSTVTSPFTTFTWSNRNLHVSTVGLATAADLFEQFPYASRVLATDFRGAAASAMVAHRSGENSFLRHRGTINLGRTRYGDIPEHWHEDAFSWMSALMRTLEDRIVILGGSAEVRRVRTGQARADVRWGSVFAAIAGRMAPGALYRGGGAVAMDGRSVAVRAYGGITIDRWQKHRADLYIAVVDGLLYDQNAADYWARKELTPPLYPDNAQRPPGDVTIKATFDAGWRWRPNATYDFHMGAGIRRSQKIYLPERTVRPAAAAVAAGFRESIRFEYSSGTRGTFWGEFTTHLLPGRQRLFWNWHRPLISGDTYDEAWDAVPAVRAGVSLATPIVSGFRLSGIVVHETGKRWREYDVMPTVQAELDGNTLVSAYVSKRLFSGLIHASVGVQNLLGEAAVTHPMGETLARSVRLDIRIDLVGRK